ncbi:DUF4236 domain-containing protein [Aurantimonas coralicida]|uniref:DUF4236 domain-containing protein n=1 Tax=Aurantimonas coralicida TaxID=182270 RepID=UPI00238E80EB|nr:DUF4236 domain-containing protein [Aurantimonas coralicida]MDE0925235.1 DUF4236 domain-containing protein [Aurantimonas coralicida]
MAFRFSRRIKILPGVRINVGKRGASLSIGPRGASVTMGRNGIHGNVGLPATGLSYRARLDAASPAPRKEAPTLPPRLTAVVEQDRIVFADQDGTPLAPSLHAAARRSMKDELRTFLEQESEDRNVELVALGQLHHDIPDTVAKTVPRHGKPERDGYPDQQRYMAALMAWRAKAANEGPDPESVEQALLDRLGALEWPRETDIAVSLRGRRLLLDVDLPEIEDMPALRWAPNHTQLVLSEKPLSQKDVAATYLAHVCAIVCRLIGHGFAASDAIEAVGVSGYTQRSSTTGRLDDDYVIVADVTRSAWSTIDVARMTSIDPENLLRRLGARFEANARGVLKTQKPLT